MGQKVPASYVVSVSFNYSINFISFHQNYQCSKSVCTNRGYKNLLRYKAA